MDYLVDTNVISEIIKAQPNESVIRWIEAHEQSLYISSITIEEMRFGALFLPEGKRKRKLMADIDALLTAYRSLVWVFDSEAAEQCADLHVRAIKSGRSPAIEDLMIAAIALCHGAPVVTRNVKDFAYLDVPVINPFEPQNA